MIDKEESSECFYKEIPSCFPDTEFCERYIWKGDCSCLFGVIGIEEGEKSVFSFFPKDEQIVIYPFYMLDRLERSYDPLLLPSDRYE